jgi:hypothetical protein
MRIKKGTFCSEDTYPLKDITHTNQLRTGSVVREHDGFVGVVYDIYTDTDLSLCLKGYDTKGSMEEREFMSDISTLKLIKY